MFWSVAVDTWTPRKQGDAGERSAIEWLWSVGADVFVPVAHTPSDFDLVACMDGRTLRVQVKTCTYKQKGRYAVMVCTRGGNQSWNGLVKKPDPSRYDYLFVHVGDGRRWFIPAGVLGGGTRIALGGPKYGEFEVEPGQPLPSREDGHHYTARPRRDSEAVKRTGL
jgi:PD-(D/E)XK endonuclease